MLSWEILTKTNKTKQKEEITIDIINGIQVL